MDGTKANRRSFLKGIATTIAAGVGLVVLPNTAKAAGYHCCRVNTDPPCPNCPGEKERYNCVGCGGQFCACAEQDIYHQCFDLGC